MGGMTTSVRIVDVIIPPIYLIWRRWQIARRPNLATREALHDEMALGPSD